MAEETGASTEDGRSSDALAHNRSPLLLLLLLLPPPPAPLPALTVVLVALLHTVSSIMSASAR